VLFSCFYLSERVLALININLHGDFTRREDTMKKYKVYRIVNQINDKWYVGITQMKRLQQRLWYHTKRERSSGAYLHWAINKHGAENFTIELLSSFDTPDESKTEERRLIELWQLNRCRWPQGRGMNLTDGGDGSYGLKHQPESIEKMSGENNHNYGLLGDTNPTSKGIEMVGTNGESSHVFGSIREAARFVRPRATPEQLKSVVSNIIQVAKHYTNRTAYGHAWRYLP
jgi:group I intron endonuclease